MNEYGKHNFFENFLIGYLNGEKLLSSQFGFDSFHFSGTNNSEGVNGIENNTNRMELVLVLSGVDNRSMYAKLFWRKPRRILKLHDEKSKLVFRK